MASSKDPKFLNWREMTPESTPGPDTDRLAADNERQKTQAAPTSHGLATPDATPEPDESRIQADKARQQQAEHADPSTQSKPRFDAESASESLQGSQSQSLRETQTKRKRSDSDISEQGSDPQAPGAQSRRPRKEAKGHQTHVDAQHRDGNAVA